MAHFALKSLLTFRISTLFFSSNEKKTKRIILCRININENEEREE